MYTTFMSFSSKIGNVHITLHCGASA